MISTKEAEASMEVFKCWLCKKVIDSDPTLDVLYYISANHKRRPSIKIMFHKQCFEGLAGSNYLFEDY